MRQRVYEFLRFCIVGFLGYVVDAGLMEWLVHLGLTAPVARLISIPAALQCTYALHGLWTYRGHGGFSRRAWLHFMAVNLLGALINYAGFVAALHYLRFDSALWNRQSALVVGMLVALWFNYWANRRFVFRAPKA